MNCQLYATLRPRSHSLDRYSLSNAQHVVLSTLIQQCYVDKQAPTEAEYFRHLRTLNGISGSSRPRRIPNTRRGSLAGEYVILPGFSGARDLPEGWALRSTYDSGGNHRLQNAAAFLWTNLWNTR